MSGAEFPRPVDRRHLPAGRLHLEANEAERAALSERFGLVSIERLVADIALTAEGDGIDADGKLEAAIVQSCAVTGDDLPVIINETVTLRFVPETQANADKGEEIELEEDELDEIEFSGNVFDLGEAVAQSLALAIDPYATGPDADSVREEVGLDDEPAQGALAAALSALKKDS
ncbi:DUF177 domain-containing protein [Altererythrobacter salegens]|uniref:DUF177 domain-containing protein n=1 Tax=Croceibacterium salegens TaxID=1737568 RepID=A0A6I4STX9_9SPHN|nr:YceD family protein [Croceibacterium salegens]MXO58507.1 DUF177 domain-containing protein [Croceibacterium salegens]